MTPEQVADDLTALLTPEGQEALRTVLHTMWQFSGGDDLRWYGVYDRELKHFIAICERKELAEQLVEDESTEIRVLTFNEASAALAAAHEERVKLARFYGQRLKPGDLPTTEEG